MNKIRLTLVSFLSVLSLHADGQSKKENDLFLSDDFLFGIENVSDASETSSSQQAAAPSQTPASRKQTGISFYGDFLYWNVYPSNYTWAYSYDNTGPVDQVSQSDYASVNFNWDVGFRVGLNYKTCYEGLTLDLSWLSFHATNHLSMYNAKTLSNFTADTGINPFMKNIYIQNIGKFYSSKASIRFNLDQIDLVAKVPFKIIDHRFSLIPFGGARAVFFKSKLKSTYLANQAGVGSTAVYAPTGPQNYFLMNQKDNFWALGLVAGMKGLLTFNHGFSFFIGADAALVGGSDSYYTYEQATNGLTDQSYYPGKEETSVKKFRPILDLETGLGWDRDFNDNKWGLGLKLAYEMHVYFDTPSFRYYYNAAPLVNTTYQGLTAGAFLRF